jgi:hypothetical protein
MLCTLGRNLLIVDDSMHAVSANQYAANYEQVLRNKVFLAAHASLVRASGGCWIGESVTYLNHFEKGSYILKMTSTSRDLSLRVNDNLDEVRKMSVKRRTKKRTKT